MTLSTPSGRSLGELLAQAASQRPDSAAIGAPGRAPLTYAGLYSRVEETARALHAAGVRRNDRVAMVLPNGPEMACAFLAVASAATAAPLNPAYRAEEFEFYLSDLNAKALLVQAGMDSAAIGLAEARGMAVIRISPLSDEPAGTFAIHGPPLGQTLEWAEPGDTALVLHTSGTTSRPKLVPLSHANLRASAENIRRSLELTPADRCLNVMPLFHIHGLVGAVLSSLAAGGAVICTPGFYATDFFAWLEECRPTWYTAVPTMHQGILHRAPKHQDVIARHPLRFIRSSSSALPRQVLVELEETFGAPVIEAYGMTEASHQMASNPLPPRQRRPGSVGIAAGPEVAVADAEGALLPAGERGEVVIRGENVTRGYESNPGANAASFTRGWFRTGDQGWLDADGYLYLTGRLKEIINRAGEKISPGEVDEVLMDHPQVRQAVTFAIPSQRLGEDVAAAVVLREGGSVTEPELRDFAATRLAEFKVPRVVRILEEIPKGPTGKLQRIGLAERLGISADDGTESRPGEYVAPRSPLETTLAEVWAGVLKVERVGVHDHFLDLGGDSVLAAILVSRVRDTLGLEIPIRSLFDAPTVADQTAVVERILVETP